MQLEMSGTASEFSQMLTHLISYMVTPEDKTEPEDHCFENSTYTYTITTALGAF